MNKHDAHLFLPLVQALADGKTIQYRSSNREWNDTDHDVAFVNDPGRYRIKPEPFTAYAILRKDGSLVRACGDVVEAEQGCRQLNADNYYKGNQPYRVITLIEKENNSGNC